MPNWQPTKNKKNLQISIGRRYNSEKKAHGGDRGKRQILPLEKTEQKLANEYQVSPKSIRNYEKKANENYYPKYEV